MSFGLVEFENHSMAVVPISWIKDDYCFWPPKSYRHRVLKATKKEVPPHKDWVKHKVLSVRIFSSFERAQKALIKLEETSNISSTDVENCGRGKRVKKRKITQVSSDSSSEDDNDATLKDVPSFNENKEPTQKECPQTSIMLLGDQENETLGLTAEEYAFNMIKSQSLISGPSTPKSNESISGPSGSNDASLISGPSASNGSKDNDEDLALTIQDFFNESSGSKEARSSYVPKMPFKGSEKVFLQELNKIRGNQETIIENQDLIIRLLSSQRGIAAVPPIANSTFNSWLQQLPISSPETLASIEKELLNEASFNELVQVLKKMGGVSCHSFVRYMLKKLMTDEFASSFSYLGVRGKKQYKALMLCKAVLYAVRTHDLWGNTPENEIEKSISEWLRHANGRVKKNSNKLLNKM